MQANETLRLIMRYRETGEKALRDAVVEGHLYIAQIIARRFCGRGVDYDDLYQVAALALVKALERFDPSRGIQFDSFVTPAMVGEVKNYFRDKSRLIRPPRNSQETARRISRLTASLTQALGRSPRIDELAQAADLREDEVLEALELSAPLISLNDTAGDSEGSELYNLLGAEDARFSDFEKRDAVSRALATLSEREREVIRLRYFENLPQRAVADRLSVSQMTVSRTERAALEALKQHINNER